MAATTALIAAAALAGAGASIYGGIEGQKAGKEQAALAESDAAAAARETQRVTSKTVDAEKKNIEKTQRQQQIAYLKSGVTLEGSPLLVMEETRRLGAENIAEIEAAGKAQSEAQLAEGRRTAQTAKAAGRQAMLQGITGTASSLSRLVK
jgi:glutaredoxin